MFDQFVDWVSGSKWSYVAIFAVSMLDAFFPIVPSETAVITGGVLAGAGDLSLLFVILAASTGAFVGDNISYWLGAWLGERTVKNVFKGEKSRKAFVWAEEPARGARLLPDHHRALHPGRPNGRDVLLRVHARHDVPALRDRRRDRGHHLGNLRGAPRLHRRQAVRGGTVEGPPDRVLPGDLRRRPRRARPPSTRATPGGARRDGPRRRRSVP